MKQTRLVFGLAVLIAALGTFAVPPAAVADEAVYERSFTDCPNGGDCIITNCATCGDPGGAGCVLCSDNMPCNNKDCLPTVES